MLPTDRLPRPERRTPPTLFHCAVADAQAAVRVWSEAQWASLTPGERPEPARHCPGLGWVAAGPIRRRRGAGDPAG